MLASNWYCSDLHKVSRVTRRLSEFDRVVFFCPLISVLMGEKAKCIFLLVLIIPVLVIYILFWNLTECSMSFLCHTVHAYAASWTLLKRLLARLVEPQPLFRIWSASVAPLEPGSQCFNAPHLIDFQIVQAMSQKKVKKKVEYDLWTESHGSKAVSQAMIPIICAKIHWCKMQGELEIQRPRLQKSILGWAEQHF